MGEAEHEEEYGLSKVPQAKQVDAPKLDYLPPSPKEYSPKIGLIGAGGITEYHLKAYRKMGLDVTMICDLNLERAESRRDEFYPDAAVTSDFREVLAVDSIEVVDIATHPEERVEIVRAAIEAKKHILSQKPFVVDLDVGQELVDLADSRGVKLAVNQNGRWAPHFRYMTRAVEAGVIGDLATVDFVLHWDHTWTAGTPFEEIHHLLLYDFAIHWFDISVALMQNRAARAIYASVAKPSFQKMKPPLLAHVAADYGDAQVRMNFNAHVTYGQEDRTIVAGQHGTIRAFGPSLNVQQVQLWTAEGTASPTLQGDWFDNGFRGTMGELLCAIEEDREPFNGARENLRSLRLCFAAMRSADEGQIVKL